ncbi:hypothetical protein [Marinimicrobium sp.]|uniref:hypothetical protein n=1 Tax=Marinimicrobium sp. TaxID=2024837 RepID=UPI000C3A135C|nr:hypothetical protein [Marinimicrobium sp.]MAN51534.1 hypothetical protein [Marinimicrobium sp.]
MYAIEFEADVIDGQIRLPDEYKALESTHLKAIILIPDAPTAIKEPANKYDFKDLSGKLTWEGDAVEAQRKIRDEWS